MERAKPDHIFSAFLKRYKSTDIAFDGNFPTYSVDKLPLELQWLPA
ncbi:hypothetical protein LEP1GSC058_0347 [Leptospira fainei serovar Hurstbridge str. BUT 6]|uniref:Uncharacterized protein n=1 Tax=Leptospira fainei serovar Hurstbridge str. BUT 6 TaxID=1193011 RepID=S3W7J4_9LEPT|nr:hypothetical protein LEP1GSC058_0347 [Leptospira fainei serovar Hurstbridge str. BUT 6]